MKNRINLNEKKEFLIVFATDVTEEGIQEICYALWVRVKKVLPGRVIHHLVEVGDGEAGVSSKIVECAKWPEILLAEPNLGVALATRKR